MAALDVVVVSTALPTLQHRFGASLADLEWTINAYRLVFGALMLTGAALGDRFGRRRVAVLERFGVRSARLHIYASQPSDSERAHPPR